MISRYTKLLWTSSLANISWTRVFILLLREVRLACSPSVNNIFLNKPYLKKIFGVMIIPLIFTPSVFHAFIWIVAWTMENPFEHWNHYGACSWCISRYFVITKLIPCGLNFAFAAIASKASANSSYSACFLEKSVVITTCFKGSIVVGKELLFIFHCFFTSSSHCSFNSQFSPSRFFSLFFQLLFCCSSS